MSVLCIMGVDPGASGAVAFYFPQQDVLTVHDTPLADGEVDAAALAQMIAQMRPDEAIIERVGAMPKQGVSSTFKFGVAYGAVRGAVGALMIPSHYVTPGKWKRHFALSSDKEEARARAIQMWPSRVDLFRRKKDHGRAEAALLARYRFETTKFGE